MLQTLSKSTKWQNTTTIIEWFKSFPQKSQVTFEKFAIFGFYPSISEELLNCSISFARSITTISDSVISIINHSRKSLPFDKTSVWVKKRNNYLFDVAIGTYDGAEIYELVELHLLNRRSTVIDKNGVVLYRDDELDAINNANSPKFDRIRKDVTVLFKEEGLSINIERYLIETDILDVNFNLAIEKYFLFRKANNTPLYINALTNNAPAIIRLKLRISFQSQSCINQFILPMLYHKVIQNYHITVYLIN